MKYYDPFAYDIVKLLNGKTPISLSAACDELFHAIEDSRVFVWRDEKNTDITNIGALKLSHSTGDVYSIKTHRVIFTIPSQKLHVFVSLADNRIAKDEKIMRRKQRFNKIFNSFKSKFFEKQK